MGNSEKISLKHIFYIAIAIFILWVAYNLFVLIYKHATGLIALVSAAGTVWAAMATWRAAEKSAESAQIAREAMDKTAMLGKQTLEETQRANRRTAFENRYALLLAQHEQYHRQLCNYLDTGQLGNRKDENSKQIKRGQDEIENFFKNSVNASTLDSCFAFLTGHEIISRYMRTLYHLLKFVSQECVFNDNKDIRNKKNYISPVRSTIRNDVLLLIAVNSLNVQNQRAKESSYPYYQRLLHEFDFFEHAIFMFPSKPNELFKHDNWEEKIHDQIFSAQSDFSNQLNSQQDPKNHAFREPVVEFRSPLIMVILIFKNPMRDTAFMALNTLTENWNMNIRLNDSVKNALEIFENAKKHIYHSSPIEFMHKNGEFWAPLKEEVIPTIQKEAFYNSCHYDNYLFKYPANEMIGIIDGDTLRYHFRGSKRNETIAREVERCNGVEGYINQYKHNHNGKLKEFLAEIDMYNVVSERYNSE